MVAPDQVSQPSGITAIPVTQPFLGWALRDASTTAMMWFQAYGIIGTGVPEPLWEPPTAHASDMNTSSTDDRDPSQILNDATLNIN